MNPCVVVAWLVALGQTVIPSRGAGGYLKWMFEAKDGYFPYDTSYAPAIMRGISPGDERVAVLSKNSKNNWVVNGLNIVTGASELFYDCNTIVMDMIGYTIMLQARKNGMLCFHTINQTKLVKVFCPGIHTNSSRTV